VRRFLHFCERLDLQIAQRQGLTQADLQVLGQRGDGPGTKVSGEENQIDPPVFDEWIR
jgi:hypothetical protein